jgi:hypothetical protein
MPYPQQLGRILGPGYNVSNLGNSGKNLLKKGLCGGGGNCWCAPATFALGFLALQTKCSGGRPGGCPAASRARARTRA